MILEDSIGWKVFHEYGEIFLDQKYAQPEVYLLNGFKVKVQTSDVIKKLLENKQQHIEQYEEAKDSWED